MSNGCHFAEKLLLCRLKTLILLNFMTVQLFARYSKLTTYMSVAPISSDILIYAFFFKSGSLGRCGLYFGSVLDIVTMLYIDVYLFLSIYPTYNTPLWTK